MNSALKPIIIIGGGGHASVLVDILRSQQREILAVVSPEQVSERSVFFDIPRLKYDDDVLGYDRGDVLLVNGVGMTPGSLLKQKLNKYYLSMGYEFETVIANSAQISSYAQIDNGAQIFSGAIVQTGAVVGAHSIVNSNAVIEHDCEIGTYNHIAPRVTLCGQVVTGNNVYIGAAATVIQNISLERDVVIGAGAIVTKDLSSEQICYPSRSAIKNKQR